MATQNSSHRWDQEADVVVVGYGAAGGVAAIAAHDAGAEVLVVEKMPHPGGISILSGGGVAFARSAEGAFEYLKRTCNGTTPDEVLRPLAEGIVEIIDWVTELAKVSGTEPSQSEVRGHGTYPFPGTNDMDSIKLKDFPAYDAFPLRPGKSVVGGKVFELDGIHVVGAWERIGPVAAHLALRRLRAADFSQLRDPIDNLDHSFGQRPQHFVRRRPVAGALQVLKRALRAARESHAAAGKDRDAAGMRHLFHDEDFGAGVVSGDRRRPRRSRRRPRLLPGPNDAKNFALPCSTISPMREKNYLYLRVSYC